MSNILNDFGLKIYNRFPPKYREDDVEQKYALKRYIEALTEGGFKLSINDINGITHIIDPERADAKILPFLFKQYGLEVFNGIPEEYLRYLLPKLSEAWSKKGSLSVVEFIASSLSGLKVTTDISYDENGNPLISVVLDMDSSIGDYFPEASQFNRILSDFIPFYSDSVLVYSYNLEEKQSVWCEENEGQMLKMTSTEPENVILSLQRECAEESIIGNKLLGKMLFGGFERYDNHTDIVVYNSNEEVAITSPQITSSITNREYNTLNGSFYTNTFEGYDKITIGRQTEVIYN